MSEPAVVYEVIDVTDDEMYFPVGVWLNLEEALEALDGIENPQELTDSYDDGESCVYEVRARKVGFGEMGTRVKRIAWTMEYDERADLYIWTLDTEEGS
jgi:hypothetical protein